VGYCCLSSTASYLSIDAGKGTQLIPDGLPNYHSCVDERDMCRLTDPTVAT